jgi:hypothetical protein
MEHPFHDKLIVFIGSPRRCTRREAREEVMAVGGVPDDGIAAFTSFVVAFDRAEEKKAYKKALEYSGRGLLIILTEEQFFDILEGRAEPPKKPERESKGFVSMPLDPEAEAREREQAWQDILNHKRMMNLKKHGVQTPQGVVKVDMRPLTAMTRMVKELNESNGLVDEDKQ